MSSPWVAQHMALEIRDFEERLHHRCHVERGCETMFSGAPCIYGGRCLFLHDDGFWYIVVIPKCLAARSPILGCIHFCI